MKITKKISGFLCMMFLLAAMLIQPTVVKADTAPKLSVGAAIADITPTLENGMLPMTGLARQNLVDVIDPIHVRVIAMNDGENTALMVAWELGDTPDPTSYIDDLAEATGVDRDAIFYCATHSHAVPDAIKLTNDNVWMQYAHQQMLVAAKEAIENMEPATVGIGYDDSYINANRNRVYDLADGTTQRAQGYNPEGVSDKTLALIRFDSVATGKPLAFVVNYAVHGVTMYANHYVVNEDGSYGVGVSADIPGYVSTRIEDDYDGSVALWISGAAGDQNPLIGNEYFVGNTETGKKESHYFHFAATEIMEYLGSVQYADVLDANEAITETSTEAPIHFGMNEETIPGYTEDTTFRASLHLLSIGDIVLLGSSGELFCQYGLTLKEASAYPNTLVVNNAATYSDEYRTYMCTDEDIAIGSGQGVKLVFAPGYLSDTLVSLMDTLEDSMATEKTAGEYYTEADKLKNTDKDYEAALLTYAKGASLELTDENKADIANCLVQVGECCVRVKHGPNGETGEALAAYIMDAWQRAGELGAGTGYFDLAMAYIGFDIPGAGDGSVLLLPTGFEAQKTGVDYLYKALELKNGKAQRYIGMCYWNGYGVEQSYEKAYELFSTTSGADLYIAYMKLYGFGGIEADQAAAIEALTKKATSMSGGNRSETQTARLLLAELYYTGSVSMELYDKSVVTATVDTLDPETAKLYLSYNQEEYALTDADTAAIIAKFDDKIADAEAKASYEAALKAAKDVIAAYEAELKQLKADAEVSKTTLAAKEKELADAKAKVEKLTFKRQVVSIKKVKSTAAKTVKVTFKKVADAEKYQILYSTKKNVKNAKKVLTTKTSAKLKLTSGKKYYVKVRAQKTIGGAVVWTKYSAVKSVKVK